MDRCPPNFSWPTGMSRPTFHGSQDNAKPAWAGMSPKFSTHAHLVRRQVRVAGDYADLHNTHDRVALGAE
jgi:hypothetical protein